MKKITIVIALIILATIMVVFTSCNPQKTIDGFALGTFYSVKADKIDANELNDLINSVENTLSVIIPQSDIYRINNSVPNEWVEVSPITAALIADSFSYAALENAQYAFNAAIFPLVDLWGFAPPYLASNNREVPSADSINDALSYAKTDCFEIEGNSVRRLNENAQLDLGGIAKGYAADVVADYLKANNSKSGLINLGGTLISHGKSSVIGIAPPRDSNFSYIASFTLPEGMACATSGDYERFYYIGDARYHHIIGKDGYPVDNDLIAATIITQTGKDADALSTITFVEGSEKAIEIIRDVGAKGILVTKNNKIIAVDIDVTINDTNYALVIG